MALARSLDKSHTFAAYVEPSAHGLHSRRSDWAGEAKRRGAHLQPGSLFVRIRTFRRLAYTAATIVGVRSFEPSP
jgi:hypothetical protein